MPCCLGSDPVAEPLLGRMTDLRLIRMEGGGAGTCGTDPGWFASPLLHTFIT